MEIKKCIKCNNIKNEEEFYIINKTNKRRNVCIECIKFQNKQWKLNNREHYQEIKKEYYINNKEKVLLKNKQWAKSNPEKSQKIKRNWQKRNKDYVNCQSHNRRAKLKNVEGKITKHLIKLMLIEQGYKCAYCGCSIKEKYTVDHIQAIHLGGNNMYENLAMSCESCNCSKGAKDLTEWARYNGWIGGY